MLLYTFKMERTSGILRLDQQIKLGMNMINNLRFMAVDGLEYLIVADQVSISSLQQANARTIESASILGTLLIWSVSN